jgi:hypothetical protein
MYSNKVKNYASVQTIVYLSSRKLYFTNFTLLTRLALCLFEFDDGYIRALYVDY